MVIRSLCNNFILKVIVLLFKVHFLSQLGQYTKMMMQNEALYSAWNRLIGWNKEVLSNYAKMVNSLFWHCA